MDEIPLIIYRREGCCLCDGLEERLKTLPLKELSPPIELRRIDIDGGDISESERARYDLEVPVMVLCLSERDQIFTLPRVSPRLKGAGLFRWLQNAITKALGPD